MSQGRTRIIAEAGVNHNGDLDRALRLVDAAAVAGVDVVKFQFFKADRLATRGATKADYQRVTTGSGDSQLDMLRALELGEPEFLRIKDHCKTQGVAFLATPFDIDSLKILVGTFNVPELKVGSGDLTNAPFLLEIARTGRSVIISTGMATLGEIEDALGVLCLGFFEPAVAPSRAAFREAYRRHAASPALAAKVAMLHCTTEYPAPYNQVNLHAMSTLRSAFGLPVGYSDHTRGIAVPIAAVALGAQIIEKHFTLDRGLPGPDHMASLEPAELAAMVGSIREVEAALGFSTKVVTDSEVGNLMVARKSLVVDTAVSKGTPFDVSTLVAKRPGSGLSPMFYWDVLGKPASRDYEADDLVEP